MKVFLLAEKLEMPFGDALLVVAQNETRARNIAATATPKLVAPDGKNLWESQETACVSLGECLAKMDERAIMKGSLLFACLAKNGEVYPLRLQESAQSFSQAL